MIRKKVLLESIRNLGEDYIQFRENAQNEICELKKRIVVLEDMILPKEIAHSQPEKKTTKKKAKK